MGRGWPWMLLATLVAVALGGCDTFSDEGAFEVVADTTQPAIARTGPDGAADKPPMMPGAEVGMAAVVQRPSDVRSVWEQLGFDQPVVSVADYQALLLLLAGGQPACCPWTIDTVEASGSQSVLVRLGTLWESTGCAHSGWQARALATTVPAGALPSTGDQSPTVSLGSDSSLPPLWLPTDSDVLIPTTTCGPLTPTFVVAPHANRRVRSTRVGYAITTRARLTRS